ncbi:MAG: YHS domain-containing protein [Chloroflexi bacterium]|jgi:xanthine dehydrogenase accessory factor|nr:YHS domain-containing protein [Chloroflexota bacterium]
MYDEFFAKASELVQEGKAFVTATVVLATKPTSGKPGDKAIVTVDGFMHGWIGGSCAQPTVVKEALKALAADESRLIRLSNEPEEAAPREGIINLPMTCYSGGTLEIFLEPQHPRPRLLIAGNLPVAQALSHLGQSMNYHVIAVNVDGENGQTIQADEVLEDLEKIAGAIRPFTYVVVATHGNYDEMVLEEILRANPTYVGLVASQKRAEAVRSYLRRQGISDTELLPLKAPAGLDIQARRGDEIALSIMAEIVQKRRNSELLDLALFHEPQLVENKQEAEKQKHAEVALDPICHMEVTVATAVHVSEFQGELYYFCCAGCKSTFENSPAQYILPGHSGGMVGLGDIEIN